MDVDEFDRLDAVEAAALVRACADIERWVGGVVAGRPYRRRHDLLTAARRSAERWTTAEVEQALRDHPRIGERHGGAGLSAGLSAREQAGAAGEAADVTASIAAGNEQYEERFGRVFLIRAAGRSGGQILAELNRRLDNDPDEELRETAEQLRQIAALRLEGLIDS